MSRTVAAVLTAAVLSYSACGDRTFGREGTTLRYASGRGIFMPDGTKTIIRLSRDERKMMNDILDNYV
ncbi:MAG: hypothetical protein E7610_00020 [Ruminococcaceae bacterium]|nr:hypothetical protein [Oscillospiraceae bacterium]